MAKGFSYTLLSRWLSAGEARRSAFLEGLLPHQLLLLFSEGSMTLELELLSLSRVEAEVIFRGASTLTEADAAFLEGSTGEDAMEREVWLTSGGQRLLYAHTLIPSGMVDAAVTEALDKKPEPLGRVLSSSGILFAKERLEVGIVKCPRASLDLGIPAETPLFARRYILFNKNGGRWIIKAAVTEIFSPELIGAGIRN